MALKGSNPLKTTQKGQMMPIGLVPLVIQFELVQKLLFALLRNSECFELLLW